MLFGLSFHFHPLLYPFLSPLLYFLSLTFPLILFFGPPASASLISQYFFWAQKEIRGKSQKTINFYRRSSQLL